MPYTAKLKSNGNYEVFLDGNRVSTTSESGLKSFGLSPETLSAPSPVGATPQGTSSSAPLPPLNDTVDPTVLDLPAGEARDPVQRFTGMSAALNRAVALARQQRQSQELDFLGGVIPKGSVSAGTFTGLLADLNTASTRFTQPLVDSTLGFAEREEARLDAARAEVKDIGLTLIENGAKSQDVSTVMRFLESGDVSGAMTAAAGVLDNLPKNKDTTFFSTADGIVAVSVDKDGNEESNLVYETSKDKEGDGQLTSKVVGNFEVLLDGDGNVVSSRSVKDTPATTPVTVTYDDDDIPGSIRNSVIEDLRNPAFATEVGEDPLATLSALYPEVELETLRSLVNEFYDFETLTEEEDDGLKWWQRWF